MEAYLRSDKDSDSIKEDEHLIREIGIRMVPSFILNRQHLIIGAEDPTVLADAILGLIKR
ncbi:MAG: hypothetical protein U0989_14135 [Azonexus sp.]|nr:hypothetical protein [Azonexus sp.]MDP3638641.1 hypothetical protein [Azonexus sp.]MDZ4315893.1 hypothetical protein [Azonexus sp.]